MRKKNCSITEVLLSLVLILGSIGLACSAEPVPEPVLPTPTLPTPESVPAPSPLTSTTSGPEFPANYTTYADDSKLFSISLPSVLEPALQVMATVETGRREIINDIKSGIPIERGGPIFVAGKLIKTESTNVGSETESRTETYDPGVTIIVEPIPEGLSTADQMTDVKVTKAKMTGQDYREVSRVKITIDGREAVIVDYEVTLPGTGKRHILKMTTLVGKTAWGVTCSSSAEDFATWENDFNVIVRSLRISIE